MAGQGGAAPDSIVLEEEIDPNYVPSEAEVVEYAKWLGMDLKNDTDLFWVAKEGLMAPLPKNWKPCKTKDTEDIYYFNFVTGESTWDHPCDGYYKRLYEEEKKKKEVLAKESSDQVRTRAKQDVDQLLGKGEKKKKKKVDSVESLSADTSMKKVGGSAVLGPLPSLEKKPLPGIQPISSGLSTSESLAKKRESPPVVSSSSIESRSVDYSSVPSTRGKADASILPSSGMIRDNNSTPSSSLEFEVSDSKILKSKKPSRLSAVIADSEDAKQDDGPASPVPTRSIKSDSKLDAPKVSTGPSTASNSQGLLAADAKKSQNVSEPSSSSANSNPVSRGDNDEIIAKLRQQVRKLENDVDTKTRQCDRFESEIADLERRFAREKKTLNEVRDANDDLETKYKRQIKTLSDKVAQLEREVEDISSTERQLRAANRELQLSKNAATESRNGSSEAPDSSSDTELLEKFLKLEQAHRRVTTTNVDLQEQLATLEGQYKAKITMLQRKFDDLSGECDALKMKNQQKDEEHATALAQLKRSLSVDVSLPSSEGDSIPRQKFLEVMSELSVVKMDRDALSDNCKRLQVSLASWETDCADKETRLQLARTRANDIEAEIIPLRSANRQSAVDLADANDKVRLLDLERNSLKEENSDLKKKLVETTSSTESMSRQYEEALTAQKRELQELLDAEKGVNKQSEKKMRGFQEELIQLQRRLQEVKDDRAAEGRSDEVAILKDALADVQSKNETIRAELEISNRNMAAVTERNSLLQAEADRLREMLHANRGAAKSPSDKTNLQGLVRDLEGRLNVASNELNLSRGKVASLQEKLDELNSERTVDQAKLNRAIEENMKLVSESIVRNATLREVEASSEKLKVDLELAEKSERLKDWEIQQVRKEEEVLRLKLEKQNADITKAVTNSETVGERDQARSSGVVYHGESSIVELSIIVGKQQAIVAQLEAKLQEAETTIKNLGSVKSMNARVETQTPVNSANQVLSSSGAPRERGVEANDANNETINKSLLREMVLDFVRRRKPFLGGGSQKNQGISGQEIQPNPVYVDWNSKILREKKFIADARAQLNDEKISIRLEQSGLLKRREAWKKNRGVPSIAGGAIKTKDVATYLNRQTLQLNLAVEQARRTQSWLDDREQKLGRLEELLTESSISNDDGQVENVGILGKELDADATLIELESMAPLHFSPTVNDEDFDQENLPHLASAAAFFSENLMLKKETNTYLQAKADEKAVSRARVGLKPSNSLAPSNIPTNQPLPTNEDRRILLMKIQRDVDERNKCLAMYQEHAGWLSDLRSEIAVFKHTRKSADVPLATRKSDL